MPAVDFAKKTLLASDSPACFWKHPAQAMRLTTAAVQNVVLSGSARIRSGGELECPVCGWRGRRYLNFLSPDEIIPDCLCPRCGSFGRHRHLVLGVRAELAGGGPPPAKTLGFSTSKALRYMLENEGPIRSFGSELNLVDARVRPDVLADLRRTPYADASVNWVFCSHVLEHVAELDPCVDEILRVLKPGGIAWIQVPLEPGLDRSRRIPVSRHRAHAHAWQFAPDFGDLIARDGWTIHEDIAGRSLPREDLRRYGIDRFEHYWLARKPE